MANQNFLHFCCFIKTGEQYLAAYTNCMFLIAAMRDDGMLLRITRSAVRARDNQIAEHPEKTFRLDGCFD